MTLERKFIASVADHQAKAARLVEQAKHETNPQFAMQLLDDAERSLWLADQTRDRANAWVQ